MPKDLLGDTDYTSGKDNRFGVTAVVGRISKIEATEKGANVRVIMPDRLDHNDQPLITKPIPVMQIASKAKKSFAMPRENDLVFLLKLPNGTGNYAVVGSFYSSSNPPPVTDPMLDYVEYDDGSTMQFDANSGELTWKIKGDCLIENEADFTFKLKGDFIVEIEGNVSITADGDIDIKADGDAVVQGATVRVQGQPIILQGDIQHTGNMNTTGTHTDIHGLHTGATREDLEARVVELERKVAAIEEHR